MRVKVCQNTDPGTLECQKVRGRQTANLGLSCPRRPGTHCHSRPRPARSTRSHSKLGPITLGYSPNSGYPRILCLPSIRLMVVRFPYFPPLRHCVHRHCRRRCCPHRRRHRCSLEPVSQQPSCPCAAEQDGIEEACRQWRERAGLARAG